MVQIEKPTHFDLFDGMNVHPVPLDFTNSITTLEMLLALQEKVNELVALWGDTVDKIIEYTDEQQKILKEEILEQITTVQNILEEYINKEIAETQNKITTEAEERQTADETLRNELLEKINSIENILNLINNGDTVSLTELFNNYYNLNNNFTNLEKSVADIEKEFSKLDTTVKNFTGNIAICHLFEQEEIENPDTLIDDGITSLSRTYSSTKIEKLFSEIKQNITIINQTIDTIGNTGSDNRDVLQTLQETTVSNFNNIYADLEVLERVILITNNNFTKLQTYIENVNTTLTKLSDTIKEQHKTVIPPTVPLKPTFEKI